MLLIGIKSKGVYEKFKLFLLKLVFILKKKSRNTPQKSSENSKLKTKTQQQAWVKPSTSNETKRFLTNTKLRFALVGNDDVLVSLLLLKQRMCLGSALSAQKAL